MWWLAFKAALGRVPFRVWGLVAAGLIAAGVMLAMLAVVAHIVNSVEDAYARGEKAGAEAVIAQQRAATINALREQSEKQSALWVMTLAESNRYDAALERIEAKFEESQEEYRRYANQVPVVDCRFDDGRVRRINAARAGARSDAAERGVQVGVPRRVPVVPAPEGARKPG